jgi:hypothetical protein
MKPIHGEKWPPRVDGKSMLLVRTTADRQRLITPLRSRIFN